MFCVVSPELVSFAGGAGEEPREGDEGALLAPVGDDAAWPAAGTAAALERCVANTGTLVSGGMRRSLA